MDETFFGFPTFAIDGYIQSATEAFVLFARPFFQAIRLPIQATLDLLRDVLLAVPAPVILALAFFAGCRLTNWRVGLFAVASGIVIGVIGLWSASMTTLSVVLTSAFFATIFGVLIGILAAQSDFAWRLIRPCLDVMQSTPSFVYLVPVVMLFGAGTIPGVIATIAFALPPVVRLTNLGLREVPGEVIEAQEAFGATNLQTLIGVRIPLALPVIMAGLNQTIMFALVMSTIAAMIGAEGLGLIVLRGIGRLDVGLATTGGLAIVLIAITLDRITQGIGASKKEGRKTREFSKFLSGALFGRKQKTA